MSSVVKILQKPASEINIDDFLMLIELQAPESDVLELKVDLPQEVRGWRSTGVLHKAEGKFLAREVVAFANSRGGRIFLGIGESKDTPRRADFLGQPFENLYDLVERLRDSLAGHISPSIQGLQVYPVPDNPGSALGYVVIDVPVAVNGPFGIGTPPECFWRRDSTCRPMTMADLHNQFWEARTNRERVEKEIEISKRGAMLQFEGTEGFCAQFTAVSEKPLSFDNVFRDLRAGGVYQDHVHSYNGISPDPLRHRGDWQPTGNGAVKFSRSEDPRGEFTWSIDETGIVDVTGRIYMPANDEELYVNVSNICGTASHLIELALSLGLTARSPYAHRWVVASQFYCQSRRVSVDLPEGGHRTKNIGFVGARAIRPVSFDVASAGETFVFLEDRIWGTFGLLAPQQRYPLRVPR